MLLALLALSLIGLLFPGVWLTPLLSIVQVIVPLQHAVVATADTVSDGLTDNGPPPSADTISDLHRENQALRNQLAAMSAAVNGLMVENARLAAIRGGGLGDSGRLVPARVISGDMHSWRDSRLINSGTLRGVRRGAPVTTHQFADFDALADSGVRGGMAVLLGEALIGEVELVGTHTARVRLLSDPESRLKIQIGRYVERLDPQQRVTTAFEVVREASWLVGVGDGRMEIRDINTDDFTRGLVRVGDTVTSHPSNMLVPAALVVGDIVEIKPDRMNPLLCVATVTGPLEGSELRRVYVYDPES